MFVIALRNTTELGYSICNDAYIKKAEKVYLDFNYDLEPDFLWLFNHAMLIDEVV